MGLSLGCQLLGTITKFGGGDASWKSRLAHLLPAQHPVASCSIRQTAAPCLESLPLGGDRSPAAATEGSLTSPTAINLGTTRLVSGVDPAANGASTTVVIGNGLLQAMADGTVADGILVPPRTGSIHQLHVIILEAPGVTEALDRAIKECLADWHHQRFSI
jgi:hypothetical protein